MADASNVEVPELSLSTPSTARKFLKSLARVIQNRRILGQKLKIFREFFEIFGKHFAIFRTVFENFRKDI